MKYTLRVAAPTKYCYIECEFEGESEEAVAEYDTLTKLMKSGEGIPAKDMNALLDEFLSTGSIQNGGNVWENMSRAQQECFSAIKRSRARTTK